MKLWSPLEFFTKTCLTNNYLSRDPYFVILAWVKVEIFLKNLRNCEVRQNFFTKTCLTNIYLSRDPHFVNVAWVQSWNIFEKLKKLWSLPEIFHKNMSHEQLFFLSSTFRDSSMGTKLNYFWKVHETVNTARIFSQKYVSRTITFHVIHITLLRVLPVENAVTLHFYAPFIKMLLSQTSFTGCNLI